MHIIVCLDERNGISFNKRRVSSDRAVYQRIAQSVEGNLWMNEKSVKLFPNCPICVDDNFLSKADDADTCFVEDMDCLHHVSRIHKITVYRWNRHYPSDVSFPAELLATWHLESIIDFPGNSHDLITEERYLP